jgi:hypothetical protein
VLQLNCALNSIYRAGKLDQRSVAGNLENATLMFRDEWLQHLSAPSLQCRQGPGLIQLHKPAVTDYIGCKYRGEAALGSFDHSARVV